MQKMFPKNSAFSKTEEQEEYQEGVRQRALDSVRENNELSEYIREAKALCERLQETLHNQEGGGDMSAKTRPAAHASRPKRPY